MGWMKKSVTRIFGLTIVIFIVTLFIVYYLFLNEQLKDSLEQQSKEGLLKDSKNISTEVEMFLEKYIVIVDQASKNPDFIDIAKEINNRYEKRENPLYSKVTNQLIDIYKMDKNISLSYIALSNSNDLITNIYEYDTNSDYDLSKREWYVTTIHNGKTTITAPYLDLVTNKMIITVATPIMDNKEMVGVFALDILIEDITTIMNTYHVGNNGYPVLVYKNGEVLFHPNFDTTDPENKIFVQDILEDSSEELLAGSGVTSLTYLGEEKFIAYLPIGNTNLIVFTIVPKAEVFHELNELIVTNSIILIGFLALTAVFLYFFQRYMANPVVKIAKEIENYSKNKTMTLSNGFLKREDEIGILSNGLIEMTNKISNYLLEIEEKNQALSTAKDEISVERLLFKTTLHSLGDAVISTDRDGNVDIMNAVAEKLTGWNSSEAKGIAFESVFNIINEFTCEKCPNPVEEVLDTGKVVELANHTILIKKNGDRLSIEDSAAPIKDENGEISGVVIVFRDFTEKKEKLERIQYLSYHDQLTGVYNRNFFEDKLHLLDATQNLPYTIVMADVNGLKLTNDAFGHQKGDQLLRCVASILKKECREGDIVARIGGDEFVLLLPSTSSNEAEKIIKRIHRSVEDENKDRIIISISVGWETKVHPHQMIDEVFAKAEEHMYRKKLIDSQSMRNRTIKVILQTLNQTNKREKIHSEKVSHLSRQIGVAMNLDGEILKELEIAGLMHDIGKIAINENTLNKTGKLTENEFKEIKRHPEIGYHILKSVDAYTNLSDYVLSHHERWDGKGYPRGLSGEEIPLVARIITVADAFEAMTAERPYRKSVSKNEAMIEIRKCSGTQFDPSVVDVFVNQYFLLECN